MKRKLFGPLNLFVSLALGGLAVVMTYLFLFSGVARPVQADPGIHYVAPGGNCGGASPCYTSVQAAVDAAGPGDEIRVAAGSFTDVYVRPRNDITTAGVVTQVVYISKTVAIRGGYTTTNWTTSYPVTLPTTLDAQRRGRVLYVTGSISPTIEGLRITGGNAAMLGGGRWGQDAGGGVYIISATAILSNSQVFSNTALIGGGVNVLLSSATLGGNLVSANVADYDGGGIFCDLSDATLYANVVTSNTAQGGGGIYVWFSYGARLMGNTISANTAGHNGGGLHLTYSDATLVNNLVVGNRANSDGSGLHIYGSSSRLLHTTIARNTGGNGNGVYVTNDPSIYSSVALTNTILVAHRVGITVAAGNTASLESTLWGNGAWTNGVDVDGEGNIVIGTHNYWSAPAFVNADAGDYHIRSTSSAIDQGINAGITTDIDSGPRPAGFGFDLGADERPDAALHLHKSAGSMGLNPGQIVTYVMDVANIRGNMVTNVLLTDTLPAFQQGLAMTATRGTCAPGTTWGGNLTCDLGTLAPGDRINLALTAQVTTTLPPQTSWRMRNIVWVTATEASNMTYADTILQDCHVRLNDDLTEYSTVQAAVDAANEGDTVKVAGFCTDVNAYGGLRQQIYLTKTVTIRGGYPLTFTDPPNPVANPTILDAWGHGRVIYIIGNVSPTLEGLVLTGGNDADLGGCPSAWKGQACGSGVYVRDAAARLFSNIITDNASAASVDNGGGMFLWKVGAGSLISGNQVVHNAAKGGGGVYLLESANATLISNTITSNTADEGGGLCLESSAATLSGNTVSANTAKWGHGGGLLLYDSAAMLSGNTVISNTANDAGGGLYLFRSAATLSGNIVASNTARSGGGLYLHRSDALLANNVFADNRATSAGSGVYVHGSSPRMLHTTIARNTSGDGSGLLLDSDPSALINAIVADDEPDFYRHRLNVDQACSRQPHAAFACSIGGDGNRLGVEETQGTYSVVTLTNTILVSHTVGIAVTAGNTATLAATLWGSGDWANRHDWDGAGVIVTDTTKRNYWGDPAFVNPGLGNYNIGPTSAAIDRGVDAGVTTDMDGQVRPWGMSPDLGADEYAGTVVTLTAVSISGPASGTLNTAYTFTATVRPLMATTPFYIWSPAPMSGQGEAVVAYNWAVTGPQSITVTAMNVGGTVTHTHVITLEEHHIYLPLVVRNSGWPQCDTGCMSDTQPVSLHRR